ncbi:hypothetical protein [Nocardioides pyridinolyticus]
MTEQQIKDGFDQLAGALSPPPDALDRVGRRVRVRRRRRRAGVAAGVALAVVATAGTAVALSGGDEGGDLIATDPAGPPQSTLTLTRADGSTYAFDDVTVTCEAPGGASTGPGQRIYLSSPRHIEGERVTQPWLYVEAILDDVAAGKEFRFPNNWPGSSEEYPVIVFVADTDGNEAASSAGGEQGTVRVLEASCDPRPVLRLEMDMSLGSEVGQEPLGVAGELR